VKPVDLQINPAIRMLSKDAEMDDRDERRINEWIKASEERSQLRLENAIARIDGSITKLDGSIERVRDSLAAIQHEIVEQRADGRALRTEIDQRFSNADQRHETHHKWVIGTILGTGVALGALIVAVVIGLAQYLGTGVQIGQSSERELQQSLRRIEDSLSETIRRALAQPTIPAPATQTPPPVPTPQSGPPTSGNAPGR